MHPNCIRIRVYDIDGFRCSNGGNDNEDALRVGSHIKVKGEGETGILAMIDNFTLQPTEDGKGSHVLEASPIGFVDADGKFSRGTTRISIPPAGVEPATDESIGKIFDSVTPESRFVFAKLATSHDIPVPVDGDRFFNKHIAVVGSTGSGKSHAVAAVLQKALKEKPNGYSGLNNSHIIVFDLHGECRSAFPDANQLTIDNLKLPFWLMNSEELEELLVDSGENQAYNQISVLRRLIRLNKQKHGAHPEVTVDTPSRFDIQEVLRALDNLNREQVVSKNTSRISLKDGQERHFISETIFSQCNNFIAMRLTNPDDQSYVRRLLPDSLGPLIDSLPTLPQGDALLIGDAVVMPAQVKLERCDPQPSSEDIKYLQEWKDKWLDAAFGEVAERWLRR